MPYTVLVTASRIARAGADRLDAAGCRVIYMADRADAAEVEAAMARDSIDAVISRTAGLSARAIAGCPSLKVIGKHGVGVSNIAVDAATARGIPVYNTPGANANAVAEMTLALMFAAARRIVWLHGELQAGRWSRAQDGLELSGRTLGLVGFGQIGQRVATVCLALGMRVMAFDPSRMGKPSPVDGVKIAATLNELLAVSDVLSLHVPLNDHTRGLIGAAQLARLPKHAILVNTARGEVVDEAALSAALHTRQLFAAGLDTMVVEPLPVDSPLLSSPNVVLTPHVGGSTAAALEAMATVAADNVLGVMEGHYPPENRCVNPQVLPHALAS